MPEEIKSGCAPSECGSKPACQGCSFNHSSGNSPSHSSDPSQDADTAPRKSPPPVRRVIGVMSGKGVVGKSLVAGALAVLFRRQGLRVGIMDADITGPSVPHMFGIREKAFGDGEKIYPAVTASGIRLMSVNLLLEEDDAPVVWRGPVLAGAVKQFWEDVEWGELDVMVIDMPPGTGDVPLTVYQSVPVSGVVIVSTPQDLVGMIVRKAIHMAQLMNIPVLGLVENLAYVTCPDCGKKIEVFGPSHAAETAQRLGIPLLAQLPVNGAYADASDKGKIEEADLSQLEDAADCLIGMMQLS